MSVQTMLKELRKGFPKLPPKARARLLLNLIAAGDEEGRKAAAQCETGNEAIETLDEIESIGRVAYHALTAICCTKFERQDYSAWALAAAWLDERFQGALRAYDKQAGAGLLGLIIDAAKEVDRTHDGAISKIYAPEIHPQETIALFSRYAATPADLAEYCRKLP